MVTLKKKNPAVYHHSADFRESERNYVVHNQHSPWVTGTDLLATDFQF